MKSKYVDRHQAMVNLLGGDAMIDRILRGEVEVKLVEKVKPKLFSSVGTLTIPALPAKSLSNCFVGKPWAYRDSDCDSWFHAKEQPATPEGQILVTKSKKNWTFREAAESLPSIERGLSIVELGNRIIELGYTITAAQAEHAVMMTESKKTTFLLTDGYGNFFFTETGEKNNPVAVGCVCRCDDGWHAPVYGLDRDSRWTTGYRLLLRNLDPTTL